MTSPGPSPSPALSHPPHRRLRGCALFALGTLSPLLFVQGVLEDFSLAAAWFSRPTWEHLIAGLGGTPDPGSTVSATLPLFPRLVAAIGLVASVLWILGAIGLHRRDQTFLDRLCDWADRGWRWWLIPGVWWLLSTASLIAGWVTFNTFLRESCELWLAVALAGWLCAWLELRRPATAIDVPIGVLPAGQQLNGRTKCVLFGAMAAYAVIMTAMNWGLWFNLRVPHGDSAMYEEHLWNLEHGKGFRSYLDQGLFLGEHIQVIHLLLVPLHLVWPSHLLLELSQSVLLALGAWPVFTMARRHSGSDRAALLLACAYLLYVPLQYLDITIDLKTFRPNSLGVPLLLFALDALERRRWLRMCCWLALMLSSQEDYAIVIGLLGAWVMLTLAPTSVAANATWKSRCAALFDRAHRRRALLGAAMILFGIGYLLLTFKVVLPYFRGGVTIHYASYFEKFGHTPGEIVRTIITQPHRVLAEVFSLGGLMYALRLLVPLGGLPLRSPGRLLVACPLFLLLCLNELAMQVPAPVHHFHAPVVPILFWAAAAGLRPCRRETRFLKETGFLRSVPLTPARFACACALCTGITITLTPLGLKFWDPGSTRYWRTLYVPNERAREFAKIDALIPADARVASTDFVHARLTHRERSYDYSGYLRQVAGYEQRVPDDTQYIVLDIEHPYNTPDRIAALRRDPYAAVRELRNESDRWELLPETGNGYFLVLRRKY